MSVNMTDEFTSFDQQAVIKVCGVGGGGGNAVNRMIAEGLKDVQFININTDAQALKHSPASTRLQIGAEVTGGLGSGAVPDVGQRAAQEDLERIEEVLQGANMVFLTAGLGGGTGTGACPHIAEIARSVGALTVAIVTLPFQFEGPERMKNAIAGLDQLEPHVDTLIVIPNDRVAALSQHNVSFMDAFRQADEVLHNGVRAISELITVPGLINLDFADVRTIMQARGRALMGIGRAEGENRAARAAEEAIVCPLLEQSNINGARSVIVNITGGCDIGMREMQEAVTAVQKAAHPDANIIFGAVVSDEDMPELQVTVIAAGFPKENAAYTPGIESIKLPPLTIKPSQLMRKPVRPAESAIVVGEAKIEAIESPVEAAAAVKNEKTAVNVEPFRPRETAAPKSEEKDDEEGQAELFGGDEKDEVLAGQTASTSDDDDFDTPTFQRSGGQGRGMPSWMRRRRG
jgi:cell division protein FtsZ